uniref:Uncharacterized protein n=1 Tax=viral metagenome TaxID=1070528 RepID=A0A6M3ME46_9ZZZZ
MDDTEVQSWWDSLHWETKETLVVGRYWRNMSSEEQDEVRHNYMLIRAGVNPIDDVDSGNLLDVVTDLMTRIDDALENIESYIPEFILTEGRAVGDTQVRPDPEREYHPKSSVDSFRDDLKKILKGEFHGLIK